MEKTLPKEGQNVAGQGIFRYKTSVSRKNLKCGEYLSETISFIQDGIVMDEDFYKPAVVLLGKIHESIKNYQ